MQWNKRNTNYKIKQGNILQLTTSSACKGENLLFMQKKCDVWNFRCGLWTVDFPSSELLSRVNRATLHMVQWPMGLAHEVAGPWVRFFRVVGTGCGAHPPPDFCLGDGCLVATCKKASDLGSGCFAWVSMANTIMTLSLVEGYTMPSNYCSARPDLRPGFATVGCLVKGWFPMGKPACALVGVTLLLIPCSAA